LRWKRNVLRDAALCLWQRQRKAHCGGAVQIDRQPIAGGTGSIRWPTCGRPCDRCQQPRPTAAVRLPCFDESGNLLPRLTLTPNHRPLVWPRKKWWFYRRRLWTAKIVDILIPTDHEERHLDTARIALSSGCFVAQLSGAPRGIMPSVDVVFALNAETTMGTIWDQHYVASPPGSA